MLKGPTPPSWFAPHLQGGFRIREFEIFIRDLTVTLGDSNYIRMEADFKRNYSHNCRIESLGWWDYLRRRWNQPISMKNIFYLPTKIEDLDWLKDYVRNRGLFNSKSATILTNRLEYLKLNGG